MLDARQVHKARVELFEKGEVSESLRPAVRPEILASWRRSGAFGAQPHVATLPYNSDTSVSERLLYAAEPVLSTLADRLAGLHAGVLLADRNASIVQRWVADAAILRELDRICSDAGFGAPEESVGTNGIGTVAALGRPEMVVGPEHFADSLVSFTCVGAPIYGPTSRRLEGVITLSCRASAANDLLTPLMMSTAADVEHRLLEAVTLDERRLLDAYLALRPSRRLVAAVGKDMLIAGSRATQVLEQLVDWDALWDVVSVHASGPARRLLPTVGGQEVALTFTPVWRSDRFIGGLVEIDELAEVPPVHQRRSAESPRESMTLPGTNAKWLAALETAGRHAHERLPSVLTGEPGVGKWRVLTEMLRSQGVNDSAHVVDCRVLAAEHSVDRAVHPLSDRVDVLVLRHLEALDSSTCRALTTAIERQAAANPRIWILATVTSASEEMDASQRALVEGFGGVVLRVPPLHERPEDIPAIVTHLVATHAQGRDVRFGLGAVRELSRASWPGNIRQLEDVVRSAVASRVGEIAAANLPSDVRTRARRRPLSPMEQLECEAIIAALGAADGCKSEAARLTGLSRSTIYRKLRAYGIERTSS